MDNVPDSDLHPITYTTTCYVYTMVIYVHETNWGKQKRLFWHNKTFIVFIQQLFVFYITFVTFSAKNIYFSFLVYFQISYE